MERGREREKEIEGYGYTHSLQRSPKKGIRDPADALSGPSERGRPHNSRDSVKQKRASN